MKSIIVIVIACSLLPRAARADDADDTLRLYLSKSEVVVLGTIKGAPESIVDEVGVSNYVCQFAVTDVAKGDAELKGKVRAINIVRFELDEKDRHPLIRKDAECVLFLKKHRSGNVPQLVSADYWFGVQHPSPSMFNSLQRLTKEARADNLNSPVDWIRIAKKHVEMDKEVQVKIDGLPNDPEKTRAGKNSRDGLTITLYYGSLTYDSLATVTVEMDGLAKVFRTNVDISGFE